jgi:hypothetical protein
MKKYNNFLENNNNIWDEAYKNTTTLVLYTKTGKDYLNTCKHK